MGGAIHCSVVNCTASIKQNKGMTFHNLPKKDSANEEWRKQLLQKINREDEGFNPETAAFCSRHFAEECFEYGEQTAYFSIVLWF